MIDKFAKHKEILMYLFFGVLTTLINFIVYLLLTKFMKFNWEISNVVAWILAVLFSYVTNRNYVFKCNNETIIKEMLSFFGYRFLSLIVDMVLMFLFVDILVINDIYAKFTVQIAVIVLNYIFSKLFVFKKNV